VSEDCNECIEGYDEMDLKELGCEDAVNPIV
jgi:hypothetical protein